MDSNDDSQRFYHEGQTAMDDGDLSGAIEHFERSAELSPHFKTYELLGECLLRENKPLEAILYLSASVGIGNKAFRAKYLLARSYLALGEKIEAYNHLKDALTMNPHYKSAKELFDILSTDDDVRKMLAREEE